MAEPSFSISIGVDSREVKSNLDLVREQFRQATRGIDAALAGIQGFAQLKRQTAETGAALNEARQRVADLARLVKSGSGGAELAAQFEQARVQAGRLKEQLAGQESRLQGLRSQLQSAGIATGNLTAAQATARRALDQTRETYQRLAETANARDVLGLRPHREIQGEIARTQAALEILRREQAAGTLSWREYAQASVAAGRRVDELRAKTNGWAQALVEARGHFVKVAAAGAGLVTASQAAIRFESAFADVRKTVDGTDQELAKLAGELRQMSHEIPKAAEDLAAIAAAGGQLGVAREDIGRFTEVVSKMSVAFDMTAEEAGNAIGKMKNVFQLTIPEVQGLGDAINQLGNNSAAREREIVDVMLRIGGTSRQFGLANEQAAALAASMVALGRPAEVAGTAINAMLSKLQTSNMQSKAFREGLQSIGLSAESMAAQVSASPQQALNNLLLTLSRLGSKERSEALFKLFGQEFQDDIGLLVNSLGTYQKNMALVADKTQYAGAMNREFAARANTTDNSLQLLKNVVTDIVRSIGDGLMPALKGGAEVLSGILRPVASLTAEFPRMSAAAASAAAGFVAFRSLGRVFGIVRLAIAQIGPAAAGSFRQSQSAASGLNAELLRTGTAASTGTNRAVHAYGNLDRALEKTRAQAKATSAGLGRIASGAGAAASKLAGLFDVGMAFSAGWFIGDMLNQFDIVRKAGASLVYGLDRVRLGAIRMWRALTGGDTGEIDREIAAAKQAYQSLLDAIEAGQDDWSKKQRGEVPELQEQGREAEADEPDSQGRSLPPPETDSETDDEAEARIARREELEQELADKRLAREQAAFDAQMARQEKLDAAAAERERAAAERQNALEEQKDARAALAAERAGELERQQEQLAADTLENRLARLQLEEDAARAAHEDRMAQLAAEAEELEAASRDKLARLAEEAEARKAAYAQTRQDIQSELDDLKAAHEAKMEMIRQELAAAEQSGDARAQRAARKKMDSEQAGYDRDSGKLARQARKAEQEEAGAVQEDARKVEAENVRAAREQAAVERRKRQEEAAETRRQKAAEAKKMDATLQEEAAERGKAEVEAEARSKEQAEAKAEKKRRRKGRARQEEQERPESAVRSATSITAAQMQEEQKAEQGLQEIHETGAQEQQARLRDAAAAEKQATEERLKAEEAATEKKKSLFEDYANRVKSLSEDMAKRSKDLQEDLIDLDPYASEEAKWQKRAELARDYEEQAKAAMQAGNLQDALKLSDQAAAAYKELKGAPEGVNEKLAANTAYQGVQAAGALAKSIEKLMAEQLKKQATVDLGPAGAAVSQAAGKLGGSGQREEPAKVVELKLGNARLSGSQQDVDDFIAQLERAGMTA